MTFNFLLLEFQCFCCVVNIAESKLPSITPSRSESNTSLMHEVHEGTVVYASAWKVAGGSIELSIEKTNGIYEGQVVIRYKDSQNAETKLQHDLDDI